MTVLRILETSLDSSDQKFHAFQLFLRVFFAETHTDAGNRNAHFQQAVIDTVAGSAKFLRIYYARVNEYLRSQVAAVVYE